MVLDKIIMDSKNIALEIKKSKEYQEYISLKVLIDSKYSKEINDFNKSKEALNLLKDTKGSLKENAQKEYLRCKEVLYQKEEVAKYKHLEKYLNDLLDNIMKEVKSVL